MNGRGDEVPSPCVGVCQLDAARRFCTGCWRTVGEITAWLALDAAARRAVWAQLPERRAAAERAAGRPPRA